MKIENVLSEVNTSSGAVEGEVGKRKLLEVFWNAKYDNSVWKNN